MPVAPVPDDAPDPRQPQVWAGETTFRETTFRALALAEIARELQGCPKDTTAAQINTILRHTPGWAYWRTWHYGVYRRAVRDHQTERARLLDWEGRDSHHVRPLRIAQVTR